MKNKVETKINISTPQSTSSVHHLLGAENRKARENWSAFLTKKLTTKKKQILL